MIRDRILLVLVALVLCVASCMAQGDASAFLGDDVLWRPREALTFLMMDPEGTGFTLEVAVRDMNVYMERPTPAAVWVTGPDDKTLARLMIPDDGIVGGSTRHQDGLYDIFADLRYRQYHDNFSTGHYPPDKQRSPKLSDPSSITPRRFTIRVPASGKGLYRVTILGSFDHWYSISSSRPVPTGVHPGAGPLVVHGDHMKTLHFYVPEYANDIGLMTTEEVRPFNWSMVLTDPDGAVVGDTRKRTMEGAFIGYIVHKPKKKNAVYKLQLSGTTAGCNLHMKGFPAVFCPDARTAELIEGGMTVDRHGRPVYFAHQRRVLKYIESIPPETLRVTIEPEHPEMELAWGEGYKRMTLKLGEVKGILAEQNLDRNSPQYGRMEMGESPSKSNVEKLALLVSEKWAGEIETKELVKTGDGKEAVEKVTVHKVPNPYYAHPGIIRRVLLHRVHDLLRMDNTFRYGHTDGPWTFELQQGAYFSLPGRSPWYALGLDSRHVTSPLSMKPVLEKGLPEDVVQAWTRSFELWAEARWMMHVGEVANQWTYNFIQLQKVRELTGMDAIDGMIRRQTKMMLTPGLMGRLCPDETPFDKKASVGYGRDVDCGRTASGYLPEQFGFDGEYTLEQTMNMAELWLHNRDPLIEDWCRDFFVLKTHVTLTDHGKHTFNAFSETCSPTDLNFRTRYYTHKHGMNRELGARLPYGDLWVPPAETKGLQPKRPWPCLETDPFVRVIDNKYAFINTGKYYAVVYTGPRAPDWTQFSETVIKDGFARFAGYSGCGYGAWGRSKAKSGAISAVFVPGCGPTVMAQNHSVADGNTVWGRTVDPIVPVSRRDVDPREVSSSFAQPVVEFDAEKRTLRMTEHMVHVPLTVDRKVTFKDDRIVVTLDLIATGDVKLAELYHAVPYVADNRVAQTYGRTLALATPYELPEIKLTPSRPRYPDAKIERARRSNKPVVFRGIDLSNKNGVGSTVVFDKPYTVRVFSPLRYRQVAMGVGSFNLELNPVMQKGQVQTVKYFIWCHDKPADSARLQRMAQDEHVN